MTYEERQRIKAEDALYRRAAERLSGGQVANEFVSVNRPAMDTGAFVEVIMWVPKAAIATIVQHEGACAVPDGPCNCNFTVG